VSLLDRLERSDGIYVPPAQAQEVLRIVKRVVSAPSSSLVIKASLNRLKLIEEAYKTDPTITSQLHDILALAIKASLPLGYSGLFSSGTSLLSVCGQADAQWMRKGDRFIGLMPAPELHEPLSEAQLHVLLYHLYCDESVRLRVEEQISSGDVPFLQDRHQVIHVVYALCDCRISVNQTVDLGDHTVAVFEQAIRIVCDYDAELEDRRVSAACAGRLLEAASAYFDAFMASFDKAVGRVPIDRFTQQTVKLATLARRRDPVKSKATFNTVIEHGMRWVVRYYAEDLPETQDSIGCVDGLRM
jgi:hypothetical protein